MVLTAIGGGGVEYQFERFTASGTWTKPDDITWVLVSVVGGGGGGSHRYAAAGGAHLVRRFAAGGVPDSVSVTVGAGGNAVGTDNADPTSGGTSKFGELAAASGGINTDNSHAGGGVFDPQNTTIKRAQSGQYETNASGGFGSIEFIPGGIWAGGGSGGGSSVYGAGGGGGSNGKGGQASGVIAVGGGAATDTDGEPARTDLCAGGGGGGSSSGSSSGGKGGVPGGGGGSGTYSESGGGEGARGEVRVWSW